MPTKRLKKAADALLRPDQREWVLPSNYVPYNKKLRYCPVCRDKVSGYNKSKYCFAHSAQETREKDIEWLNKTREITKYYQKKREECMNTKK